MYILLTPSRQGRKQYKQKLTFKLNFSYIINMNVLKKNFAYYFCLLQPIMKHSELIH